MMKNRFISLVALTALSTVALMRTAWAYIDPGTTSYMIQIIAGVVITIGVSIGVFWKRIRLFFRNMKLKMLERKLQRQGDKKSAS